MQSIEKVNLTRLKKCNQVWEEMTPNERGRVCRKCQNTIIDFRALTNKEIAETHVFAKGKVCGLYNEEQLQIRMPIQKKRKTKSFLIGFLGILTTTNLNAQTQGDSLNFEQVVPDYDGQILDSSDSHSDDRKLKDSIIISGIIRDENGEALIYANVYVKETRLGTTSDLNGFYSLDISEHVEKNNEITLIYSYLGFNDKEVVLKKGELLESKKNIDISMLPGEIIEFYVVTKTPLHKRIWRGIKRIFQKKK